MYKAFKIGAYQIGETIVSQSITFGIADFMLYRVPGLVVQGLPSRDEREPGWRNQRDTAACNGSFGYCRRYI